MNLLPLIDPDRADLAAKLLLDEVKARLGVVPNMTKAMANSPALLKGYLALSGALSNGSLGLRVSELLALAIAQSNGCSYCLSAHTYLAEHVANADADTIAAARKADASDPKTTAILRFAAAVNDARGSIDEGAVDAARTAGVTNEELAETVAHVALNVLTNFFNTAFDVDIDFPVVTP